jgi:hypothetical protein
MGEDGPSQSAAAPVAPVALKKSAGAFAPKMPAVKATNGHGGPSATSSSTTASRRKELPMDGDFKDF